LRVAVLLTAKLSSNNIEIGRITALLLLHIRLIFSKSKTMNISKFLTSSITAVALALSFGLVSAQSSTGNVNESGAKTMPDAGTPSGSNAADAPRKAGTKSTSNTTRKESTAAAKGSENTNEAGATGQGGTADKPKAASKTTLIRDANGKFVPRSTRNGTNDVKDNNEAGAKSK
jgi:cytoskeletal protein RodZ